MKETRILPVGKTDFSILERIAENLRMIFPDAVITVAAESLPIPEEAFSKTRQQYLSEAILRAIHARSGENHDFARVVGIADIDLFIPRLNYVFGQAECPGTAALISLFRLRPEFYGKPSDAEMTVDRGTKEAVHEIGHTLGLQHCANPFCVMYFSNSIFETDRKQSLLCNKCYLKAQATTAECR